MVAVLDPREEKMIPLKDENPTHITPFVNYSLIAINILVFVYQVFITPDPEAFVMAVRPGARPSCCRISAWAISPRLFSSMFMHGGFLASGREYALPVDLWR
jgi:membrane associated rhomboid family serine protease